MGHRLIGIVAAAAFAATVAATGSTTQSWRPLSMSSGATGGITTPAAPGNASAAAAAGIAATGMMMVVSLTNVVQGLAEGAAYEFCVAARSEVGLGPPSEPTLPVAMVEWMDHDEERKLQLQL